MKKHFFLLYAGIILFIIPSRVSAQEINFTRQDTLRGSVTPERVWWDVEYYHLNIEVNPADSTIKGSNKIIYSVLKPSSIMQIDMQEPMILTKVVQNGVELKYCREGNVFWVNLIEPQETGDQNSIIIYYGGRPKIAARPPWDGGITWKRDSKGLPFVGSSCQGDGASLWWPCKDHMYDEPDSMLISVTVPDMLMNISNGRLRSVVDNRDNTKTFNWFVSKPISNYVVNINIGDYTHFSEVYKGEKGSLDCDYYVLKENITKAKNQFKQVPMMLKAFEHWFGPYPFYEDGYKLVEAPYLGMEHQSSVTYGNGFKNGYRGTDLSGSGWGMKFDFIIVHESGHEWFGNSITYRDIADMWIHESFTNYSESLYTEYYYGKDAGSEYAIGCRRNILNDRPVIGIYDVNHPGSHDMYFKGSNMLNTMRYILDNDAKWREILRGLNIEFYHKVVTGKAVENYMITKSGIDFQPVFDQYLRDTRIPVLEYYLEDGKLFYRWINCVDGFNMQLKIYVSGVPKLINPTTAFSSIFIGGKDVIIKTDPNYFVGSMNMSP